MGAHWTLSAPDEHDWWRMIHRRSSGSRPASPESLGPHVTHLLDAIPLGVQFVAKRDGREVVVFVNRRFCELLGVDVSDVLGADDAVALQRFGSHLETPLDAEPASEAAADGQIRTTRVVVLGQARRILECITGPVRDPDGASIGRMRVLRDVTDADAAGAAHTESETRLAGIIASAMDAIITVDESHRVVVFNAAAEKMFGIATNEALGKPLDRFIPERFRSAHREHIRDFGRTNVTKRAMGRLNSLFGIRSGGEEFPIEASISQVEVGGRKLFTVILRDITDKRRAETQLLRAQRLESVGTLAGGLAHDLNNILAPIMVSIRLLERRLVNDPEGLECVAMLEQLADRGAGIVRQVLSFARGEEGERVPTQAKHIVREVAEILRETLPRNITVRQETPSDLWTVLGDATQLHQVLMNLVVNARDAMPAGGTLTLTTQNVTVDPHFAQMHPESHPGRYVSISVVDTGTGIAPDHLDRIFDPFYTTKAQGEGTGLGLSTTLGIVRAHQGFISVYSEPGRGSRFTFYLPALDREIADAEAGTGPALPTGHGELVMVVDDEAMIRDMTGRTLREFGYRVLTAEDGTEAVTQFAKHQGEVAAVVLDMMMPVMDGVMTARALRRMVPDVRLIGSSGLAEKRKLAEAEELGLTGFLLKPYTADQLLHALAEALGNQRS
jgi:PAS domain S-box-containing protein